MIEFFETDEQHKIKQIDAPNSSCWIKVTAPTDEEVDQLCEKYGIPHDYFFDALDTEERSRVEMEREVETFKHSLVIVDCPYVSKDEMGYKMYETLPIGIILTHEVIMTVTLKKIPVLENVGTDKTEKYFDTHKRGQFLLMILYAVSFYYLRYLNEIIRSTNQLELKIKQSMKNEELYAFMAVQKSLVFFATALQSNKATLDKIASVGHFMWDKGNRDLLQDVLVENKQAIAMTDTYTQIISGMSDIFSSVISNNLNMVMKFLTSFTIILSLPTIIGSIYGMNVKLPFAEYAHAFSLIMIFTLVVTLVVTLVFWRKKYF
ncbi:magnesium transporter CorA family protein [Listeria aquatica]|uniref:Magnesium transporter CorA family protein n=1 Tax=Listeria aquatica TaxID=1494960 RepID=A0A841ZSX2_9LIST|nr:magnesium transporter CorA family protein [Listeria aquatica]MBC1522030.1 magnesium transporter CorA family protein [Listeria aquatica]